MVAAMAKHIEKFFQSQYTICMLAPITFFFFFLKYIPQVLKRTHLVYYHSPVRISEISWNFSSFIHTQGRCLIEIRQAKPIKSILCTPTSSTQTRFCFTLLHQTNSLDSVYRYFGAIYYNKNQFAVKINRAPHFWQTHTHTHFSKLSVSLEMKTWKLNY